MAFAKNRQNRLESPKSPQIPQGMDENLDHKDMR